jgi:hypothetical protein
MLLYDGKHSDKRSKSNQSVKSKKTSGEKLVERLSSLGMGTMDRLTVNIISLCIPMPHLLLSINSEFPVLRETYL